MCEESGLKYTLFKVQEEEVDSSDEQKKKKKRRKKRPLKCLVRIPGNLSFKTNCLIDIWKVAMSYNVQSSVLKLFILFI